MEINKIYEGDCMEIMKGFPDCSINCVITDPPYGMNKGEWDKKPMFNFMKEIFRILKDNSAIYIFCGDNSYIEARTELEKYFDFHRTIIWEKENVHGGGDFLLAHEYILYAKKGKPIFNNIGRKATSNALMQVDKDMAKDKSVWKSKGFNNTCNEYVGHPTQKPLQIIRKMILNSTNEGDIILDIFAGSGTTLVACKQLNRRWVGIEVNPDYVSLINKRLKQNNIHHFQPTQAEPSVQSLNTCLTETFAKVSQIPATQELR